MDELLLTKDDAQNLISHLGDISHLLYKTNAFEEKIDEFLTHQQKAALLKILEENHIDTKDIKRLEEFLKNLILDIERIPVVTLNIAFEPSSKTIAKFLNWFAIHLKQHVLLDITVDPSLIGGAIISYSGRYLDYSLKKKLGSLEIHI